LRIKDRRGESLRDSNAFNTESTEFHREIHTEGAFVVIQLKNLEQGLCVYSSVFFVNSVVKSRRMATPKAS
jgi:hypothetical protein